MNASRALSRARMQAVVGDSGNRSLTVAAPGGAA